MFKIFRCGEFSFWPLFHSSNKSAKQEEGFSFDKKIGGLRVGLCI